MPHSTCPSGFEQLPLDFEQEIWKPIPGYETRYDASSFGRIRSWRVGKSYYLKPAVVGGYLAVSLCIKGVVSRCYIHRLVMLAFVGPSELQVNHKNGQRDDNFLSNLEYVTRRENMIHAIEVLKRKLGSPKGTVRFKGEAHPMAKVSDQQVVEIRRLYNEEISRTELARRYGISRSNLWLIGTGRKRT